MLLISSSVSCLSGLFNSVSLNSILLEVNAIFNKHFKGLIQLPVTLLNVPVSNLLNFILGSKAKQHEVKKKCIEIN